MKTPMERIATLIMAGEVFTSKSLAEAANIPRKSINYYIAKFDNSKLGQNMQAGRNPETKIFEYQYKGPSMPISKVMELVRKVKTTKKKKTIQPKKQGHIIPVENMEEIDGLEAFLAYVVRRGIKVTISFSI